MLEVKDPAIKLFGQTIPVPADEEELPDASGDGSAGEGFCSTGDEGSVHDLTSEMEEDEDDDDEEEEEEEEKESGAGEEEIDEDKVLQVSKATENENEQQDDAPPPIAEESVNPETSPGSQESKNESSKAPSMDEPNATSTNSKSENEENEKGSSQEKTLKKPDKILPCPRCNSMDTKFCYYNNYNVNQPRHFCKNCQRYWTNGGTMRNVPVGAGRRKNKNAASHYRHVTISDALQTAQISAPNGIHHPTLKTNGTVLNFGSDATLSESMASVLNIADKTMWDGVRNEYHKPEQSEVPNPGKAGENVEDHSSGCSTVGSNSMEESDRSRAQEPSRQNLHGFPSQIPCIPGIPWPYPWGAYPGIPMFYPPTYWNCAYPGAWPVPLLSPPSQTAPSSGPNSPTLGKHSRDGNTLEPRNEAEELPKEKNSGRNIWVPKTLRIDDPDEAAKSSIWATLGIKHESISKGGLFKGFQAKDHTNETDPVLQANPAALSRSLNFHESS